MIAGADLPHGVRGYDFKRGFPLWMNLRDTGTSAIAVRGNSAVVAGRLYGPGVADRSIVRAFRKK